MLVSFSFANFKSFRDETKLSLEPVIKQKDLLYSILHTHVGKEDCQGLCSSVFYGPNASGKSNVICALHVFKMIILRGNIRNKIDAPDPDAAAQRLELIPNQSFTEPHPTSFSITFCHLGHHYTYHLSFLIGTFLDTETKREILEEVLVVDGKEAFRREAEQPLSVSFSDQGTLSQKDKIVLSKASSDNLDPEELFLTGGFKSLYAAKQVAAIQDWFRQYLLVFFSSNTLASGPLLPQAPQNGPRVTRLLEPVLPKFGITGNALGYFTPKGETDAKLCSLIPSPQDPKKTCILPAETFESLGTVRFMNLFPLLSDAIKHGKTLVIDEFDASLHSFVVMNIIKIFHNDEINTNGAQLLFNTQNPLYLDGELFRRDEIKFIDRDEHTQASTLYALSDFPTTGANAVRKGEDYLKNYLIGKYGAVRHIDLSPLFTQKAQSRSDGEKGRKS